MIVYGSVCSGVGAATVAWRPLGWFRPAWFSEILPFPSAVLKHHYPETPNLGDMTKIYDKATFLNKRIDILVGGTPCQSFSVAGLRKALEDPRGNLMLEFLRLAHIKRPRWLVWENVPGVLSSNGGRDFGSLLGALRYLGYFGAWRVLDSQYFGVPQKRRRVFVVGHRGDWRPPAEVLLESSGLPGRPAPNKEIQQESPQITFERPSSGSKPLAFGWQEGRSFKFSSVSNPLTISQTQAVVQHGIARKFTPLEYERLMGFPDNYSLIPYGRKAGGPDGRRFPASLDGLRYKALGNSIAIPIMSWLGRRIKTQIDAEISEETR
jgi:site-specific DNA-cytosine methylase